MDSRSFAFIDKIHGSSSVRYKLADTPDICLVGESLDAGGRQRLSRLDY